MTIRSRLDEILHGHGEHAAGAALPAPGRCHFDSDGKLRGPVRVTCNDPFPTRNGSFGSGSMDGVLMHTMVGNLQPGTVATFNNPAAQASAHFGIAQDGSVWQFGPVGKGWIAWHAEAANATYYGIEHADDGNPDNPLTEAQVTASAQVVEALSAFAGFPLREANAPGEKGYGVHYMGGAGWGGHTCPDLPPRHVRSRQRPAILALAAEIRNQGGVTMAVTANGIINLQGLAGQHHALPSEILRMTAVHDGKFAPDLADWINGIFAGKRDPTGAVPKGIILRVPAQ